MIWFTFAIYLSRDFREKNPQVFWKDIEGMKDRLIHHYFGINLKDVWYTVKVDIPDLKNEILAIPDVLGTEK